MIRRDRSHQSFDRSPRGGYGADRGKGLLLEAGGIPKPADRQGADFKRLFAERLGIVAHPPIDIPTPERFTDVDLGNKELPIYEFKQKITDSVRDNIITIVTAETGAGKSTQVPQFLLGEGYKVTMTQPRRIAAQMLSEQIDRELVKSLETEGYGMVGFQTARHNTINDRTRIAVVTDGLRLVQELNDRDEIENEVLIIDEVHEWNTNMELLIALVKKMTTENPRLRVVIMSATIDTEALANYFTYNNHRPPIIEVPGRNHEVEMTEEPDSDVVTEAVKHAAADRTVLIFLPGLREIEDTKDQILKQLYMQGLHGSIKVLSLYGDMSQKEQDEISAPYHGARIICATNVAQTSITIPDVDVVVDSGLERRNMIDDDGIESLELNHISRADCNQRAGRCGRVREGTYVLTRYISSEMRKKKKANDALGVFRFVSKDEPYHKSTKQGRLDYPVPEILRTNADRSTLAMAGAGLDLRTLDLYHPLNATVLKRSANLLRVLGAFDDKNNITHRGMRMNRFPVKPTHARMLTYAEEHNFNQETKLYVAGMVASMETGGLPDYSFGSTKEWRTLAPERSSDYLSQLNMFLKTQNDIGMKDVVEMNLNPRNVLDAQKTYEKLARRMGVQLKPLPIEISTEQSAQISDAVVAGMVDFVYRQQGGEYRRTSEGLGRSVTMRVLSDRSLVRGNADYVVATPYKIPAQHGNNEKHILQDVHKTTPAQLGHVAIDLCDWQDESTVWRDGKPKVRQRMVFRETVPIDQWQEVDAKWSPELREVILREVKAKPGPTLRELQSMKRELEMLWNRTKEVDRITQDEIDAILNKLATRTVLSPGQLDNKLREHLFANEININAYAPYEKRAEILMRSPDFIEWKGLQLQLQYKSGRPTLRHVTPMLVNALLERSVDLLLPDGRAIYIPRGKKQMTLWELRQQTSPKAKKTIGYN